MLILASNSPRRKQLLSLGGWDFMAIAPDVNEAVLPGEAPADYVLRLAQQKAKAVRDSSSGLLPEAALILAADTAVIDLDQSQVDPHIEQTPKIVILGKPAGSAEAEAMLFQLRGRNHFVYTGLTVLRCGDGAIQSTLVVTEVPMRDYSDEEIRRYVSTGDPLDKAGAYAIQHPEFKPVQNLQGCYANVMGLPVCHAARLLGNFGSPPIREITRGCMETLDYPCEVYLQVQQR